MGPWRTPDWHALGPPGYPLQRPRGHCTQRRARGHRGQQERCATRPCEHDAPWSGVGTWPSDRSPQQQMPALQPAAAPFGISRIFDRRLNRATVGRSTLASVPAAVWRYGDTHTAGAAESWRRWRMLLARPARAPGRSGTGAWRRRSVFRRWPAWQQALVVRGAGAASLRGGAGRC